MNYSQHLCFCGEHSLSDTTKSPSKNSGTLPLRVWLGKMATTMGPIHPSLQLVAGITNIVRAPGVLPML